MIPRMIVHGSDFSVKLKDLADALEIEEKI